MVSVLRPNQRIVNIPAIGVTTSRRAVQVAASADWWAVTGKTCEGAYLGKNAASLAASLVNLANPGTYDLSQPGNPVPWSAAGWAPNGDLTHALRTGISPTDQDWSIFVQVADGTSAGFKLIVGGSFWISDNWGGAVLYRNGDAQTKAPGFTAGNLGISGLKCYRDGTHEQTLGVAAVSGIVVDLLSNNLSNEWIGTMIAAAIYSDVLTDGEVAALVGRMAAL